MNNTEAGIIGIIFSFLAFGLFYGIPLEFIPSILIALWVIIVVFSILLIVIEDN